MSHTGPGARRALDAAGLASVLAGTNFPAKRWQLIAQADYFGIDAITRDALTSLPVGVYADLPNVLSALHTHCGTSTVGAPRTAVTQPVVDPVR